MSADQTLFDFTANRLDGRPEQLADYRGKVVLVVNTASRCGFTPQLAGLQKLHETYQDQGFEVLGFPCNQFANQEPGSNDEVGEFCQSNYGVSFPMFEKVAVNGTDAHPVWSWLRTQKSGILNNAIKWNFTKFLIGRDGHVLERFAPQTSPESLGPAIEMALADD